MNGAWNLEYHPTIKHRIEYIAVHAIMALLRIIPYRAAVRLGGIVGRILWHLGIRRKVSRRNFELCFRTQAGTRYRDRILKKSYDNFCRAVAEYVLFPKIARRIGELVRFENDEALQRLKSAGQGAILSTGHFGSWELFGAALANAGYMVDVLVGTQRNQLVDKLMNDMRRKSGVGVIHIGVAARGVMKSLREGRMVAILSDQDAHEAGIVVKFFGQPASTLAGAAMFAVKTKCPIVAGYIVRNDDGFTHTGYVRKLAVPVPTGNQEDDIQALTQFLTDVLEEGIRAHPEQYFWAHKRFKSTIGYE